MSESYSAAKPRVPAKTDWDWELRAALLTRQGWESLHSMERGW
jgi:hypothetical protein